MPQQPLISSKSISFAPVEVHELDGLIAGQAQEGP